MYSQLKEKLVAFWVENTIWIISSLWDTKYRTKKPKVWNTQTQNVLEEISNL